jgi:RNA polymerase sigma factor (sigma-70 family)
MEDAQRSVGNARMTRSPEPGVVAYVRSLVAREGAADVPDQELLARFLSGKDAEAFDALVRRHGAMVRSVCSRLLHCKQDVEDACQATFLVLIRKAVSIRRRSSVASWLHGVAYHIARDARARASRRATVPWPAADVPQSDERSELLWREVQTILDEELQRLAEKYRAPLVLCYLEGRTRDEAARALGWTTTVLRGRLERGRHTLRDRLISRGLTLSAAVFTSEFSRGTADAAWAASFAFLPHPTTSNPSGFATISESALTLAGALEKALLLAKVRTFAAVLLAGCLLASGAGLVVGRALHIEGQSSTPAGVEELTLEEQAPRLGAIGALPAEQGRGSDGDPARAKAALQGRQVRKLRLGSSVITVYRDDGDGGGRTDILVEENAVIQTYTALSQVPARYHDTVKTMIERIALQAAFTEGGPEYSPRHGRS